MGCGASAKKYKPEEDKKTEGASDAAAPAKEATAEAPAAQPEAAPAAAAEAPAGESAKEATKEKEDDEASEEDEEDVMDEGAFEEEMRKRQEMQAAGGPRKGVSAEGTKKDENWIPPVHEKTDEQVARLKTSLSRCFMFACLDEDQIKPVIAAFMETPMSAGTTVITQGAEVGSAEPALFVIESGQLSVYKKNIEKSVFTYTIPGQLFGDLALLYNAPRAATVQADVDSMLWSIDRDTFNNLVKDAAKNSIERRMGFLKSVPLLSGLTRDELATVCDALQAQSITAGAKIIGQGDAGNELYIVESGKCEARIGGSVVKTYEEKDFFGELALLKETPRAADVFAVEDSRILGLGSEAFTRLLGPLESLLAERAAEYNLEGLTA